LNWFFPQRFVKKILAAGMKPDYFLNQVIPVTRWGSLRTLRENGFSISDIYGSSMPLRPGRTLQTNLYRMRFYNPFIGSVLVAAQKK
jgi:hypothetical protein